MEDPAAHRPSGDAGPADPGDEAGNRRKEGKDGLKSTMLRRFDPAGALIFSVCGLFCGQSPNPKFQASQKVMKNKVKPPFSTEKSGFRGAAGRIRTADLILTNGSDEVFFCFFTQKRFL